MFLTLYLSKLLLLTLAKKHPRCLMPFSEISLKCWSQETVNCKLPTIPFGVVVFTLTLYSVNLSRNSSIDLPLLWRLVRGTEGLNPPLPVALTPSSGFLFYFHCKIYTIFRISPQFLPVPANFRVALPIPPIILRFTLPPLVPLGTKQASPALDRINNLLGTSNRQTVLPSSCCITE